MVRKDKWELLQQKMEELGLFEKDLVEKFILGTGRGGQNLQKTFSCVYLKHLPSSLEIKCQKERSQDANRYLARVELLERYKEKVLGITSKKTENQKKIRKQKKRVLRRKKNTNIPSDSDHPH